MLNVWLVKEVNFLGSIDLVPVHNVSVLFGAVVETSVLAGMASRTHRMMVFLNTNSAEHIISFGQIIFFENLIYVKYLEM